MPPAGLDNLRHIVVLMIENRSFDHMPRIIYFVGRTGSWRSSRSNTRSQTCLSALC